MIGATVFLVAVILLVGKIIVDVQITKIKRVIEEIERYIAS